MSVFPYLFGVASASESCFHGEKSSPLLPHLPAKAGFIQAFPLSFGISLLHLVYPWHHMAFIWRDSSSSIWAPGRGVPQTVGSGPDLGAITTDFLELTTHTAGVAMSLPTAGRVVTGSCLNSLCPCRTGAGLVVMLCQRVKPSALTGQKKTVCPSVVCATGCPWTELFCRVCVWLAVTAVCSC